MIIDILQVLTIRHEVQAKNDVYETDIEYVNDDPHYNGKGGDFYSCTYPYFRSQEISNIHVRVLKSLQYVKVFPHSGKSIIIAWQTMLKMRMGHGLHTVSLSPFLLCLTPD